MSAPDEPNEPNNRSAVAALIIILLVLAAAAYAKVPAFRTNLDANAPWFRGKVGHFLVGPGTPGSEGALPDGENPDAPIKPVTYTIETLATYPAVWPKSLILKRGTDFPAVINKREVGRVVAPAGSHVHLMKIRNGKLGVEFQGGGNWVAPEVTDLNERVRLADSPH